MTSIQFVVVETNHLLETLMLLVSGFATQVIEVKLGDRCYDYDVEYLWKPRCRLPKRI